MGGEGCEGVGWFEEVSIRRRSEGREGVADFGLLDWRRIGDPNTIDLHNVTLQHALTLVHEGCNTWYSARELAHTPSIVLFPTHAPLLLPQPPPPPPEPPSAS